MEHLLAVAPKILVDTLLAAFGTIEPFLAALRCSSGISDFLVFFVGVREWTGCQSEIVVEIELVIEDFFDDSGNVNLILCPRHQHFAGQ